MEKNTITHKTQNEIFNEIIMRIGILTFHRANNYGAVLQCFALQEQLRQLGCDVEVIDYRQPVIEKVYRKSFDVVHFAKSVLRKPLIGGYEYICLLANLRRMEHNFSAFRDKYLRLSHITSEVNIPTNYDIYIIGSDQLWNIGITGGYDVVYWGHFRRNEKSKLYGYAISGDGNIDLSNNYATSYIKRSIANFNDVTFREEKMALAYEKIINKRFRQTIDPTLLNDEFIYHRLLNNKWCSYKYVLVYEVRTPKKNKKILMKRAKLYAKVHGLQVIYIGAFSRYSIEDFLSLIKYAHCVFTSSFHATVFSILFKKSFLSFCLNDGGDARYTNLLNSLGLQANLANPNSSVLELPMIDYKSVDEKLSFLRKNSLDYITEILQK